MIKYMHIERLGNDEVDGLLSGQVLIQPKLDGTNGQIYFEDGMIKCASRNHVLSDKSTNQGFWNHVQEKRDLYMNYFSRHPFHILYGEWLVPHTLKTYRKDAWNKFYIFDIFNSYSGMFIPYDSYIATLMELYIPFIPVIGEVYNSTEESLLKYLDTNTFLIENGSGSGEGVVLKNYNFINKYGRATWGKLVKNEFKEEMNLTMGHPKEQGLPIEYRIALEFITEGRLEKIKSKMIEETPWTSKRIPEYLGKVWFEIVQDEMWNILKKYKNPRIDFRALHNFVILTIKEIDKETF